MTAPATKPLTEAQRLNRLRAHIRDALAEVRAAEAAAVHCPSPENLQYAETAWYSLDQLLDQLPREETPCSS